MADANHNGTPAPLWDTVVRRGEDATVDAKPVLRALRSLLEGGVLVGSEQFRDVLHDECIWFRFVECTKVFAPEGSSFEADAVSVERGEALTRRPAYHHVRLRKRLH